MAAIRRCFALVLLTAATAAAQSAPTENDLLARGVKAHQAGDVLGAIEAYQAALERAPDRVDIRSNLGAAFARLGRHEEAIAHYRAALAKAPAQTAIRFNLAVALYKSARIPDARTELERVLAEQADNRNALLLLADCQLQTGDDGAVVALLGPHEDRFKDDRLFAYLMGNALLRRNELLRGQAYIDRLFKDGETAEARLLMGVAQLERRDGPAAVKELERAVALNASLPAAHSLLGRALVLSGRRDDAIAAFRRELEIAPNDFDANLQLGLLLKDDHKLDESFELLARAGRLRPGNAAVLYGLGALHLAAGRVEEARAALERVVAQAPDYRQAHVLLATAYYRQKQKGLGDRHRAIAERLTAEQQSREPQADGTAPPVTAADPPPVAAVEPGPTPMTPGAKTVKPSASSDPRGAVAPSLVGADRAVLASAIAQSTAGNPDAAFETLRRFAAEGQDHPAVLDAFGLAMLRLTYAPDRIPENKREMVRLAGRGGYHLARVRRSALGRLAFEELVSRFPSEPNVHYAFGNYLLVEEPDRAIEEYRKELRLSPDHYPSMLQIAVAETGKGRAAEAVTIAEKAVAIAPNAPAGRLVLGRALLEAGQAERAIQELEAGAKLSPANPGFYFSLARAYRTVGREADAARARARFAKLERGGQ
jgi:tetratricopeptide (TPR) repeat protein